MKVSKTLCGGPNPPLPAKGPIVNTSPGGSLQSCKCPCNSDSGLQVSIWGVSRKGSGGSVQLSRSSGAPPITPDGANPSTHATLHGGISLKARQRSRKPRVGVARSRGISRFSPSANFLWRGAGIGKQASLETKRVNSPRTVGTCPLRHFMEKSHSTVDCSTVLTCQS